MTKSRNMKIEINEDQPLDEVVRELERLGFRKNLSLNSDNVVYTLGDGFIRSFSDHDLEWFNDITQTEWNLTTLAELKEMKND